MTGDWRTRADIGGDVPVAPRPAQHGAYLSIDEELRLVCVIAALQRVNTEPGSGHLNFIREMRGKRPAILSDAQRQQLTRLAWKYRLQLPTGVRPASNPDTPADVRKN